MDWAKQLAKEQVVTFLIGFLIEVLLAVALGVGLYFAPDPGTWSGTAWGAAILGALGAIGFNVTVVILMASHKATDVLEKRVDAQLEGIPERISNAVRTVAAEIKADKQSELDLRVREIRHSAETLAVEAAHAKLKIETERALSAVEVHARRADDAIAKAEGTVRLMDTLVTGFRAAGFNIRIGAEGVTLVSAPKSDEA